MLSITFGYSKFYVDSFSENVRRGNRTKRLARPVVGPLLGSCPRRPRPPPGVPPATHTCAAVHGGRHPDASVELAEVIVDEEQRQCRRRLAHLRLNLFDSRVTWRRWSPAEDFGEGLGPEGARWPIAEPPPKGGE